jgi:hypothetical protein
MGYITSKSRINANDELQKLWNGTVLADFKAKPQHMLAGTEQNHELCSQDVQPPGSESNREPLEYRAGILIRTEALGHHITRSLTKQTSGMRTKTFNVAKLINPSQDLNMNQIHTAHITITHLANVNFNIIFPSQHRWSNGRFPRGFNQTS